MLASIDWPKRTRINPIVAKAGWLQRRGIKGEDVIFYFELLITKDLESSGFPGG